MTYKAELEEQTRDVSYSAVEASNSGGICSGNIESSNYQNEKVTQR